MCLKEREYDIWKSKKEKKKKKKGKDSPWIHLSTNFVGPDLTPVILNYVKIRRLFFN